MRVCSGGQSFSSRLSALLSAQQRPLRAAGAPCDQSNSICHRTKLENSYLQRARCLAEHGAARELSLIHI
eukprot:2653715-Pyramimonas_sp.AAC.1